jgi:hypothetical protein
MILKRGGGREEGEREGGRERKNGTHPHPGQPEGAGAIAPTQPPVRDHLVVEELGFLGER